MSAREAVAKALTPLVKESMFLDIDDVAAKAADKSITAHLKWLEDNGFVVVPKSPFYKLFEYAKDNGMLKAAKE